MPLINDESKMKTKTKKIKKNETDGEIKGKKWTQER